MTYEQVKKSLEWCASNNDIDEEYDNCGGCNYIKERNCTFKLIKDALALINRLEEESADKERYTIELYNRAREAERKVNKWKQAFIEFDKFGDITTPMGVLPINTEGMQQLVDYCNSKSTEINRLEEENKKLSDKNKELRALCREKSNGMKLDQWVRMLQETDCGIKLVENDHMQKETAKDILQSFAQFRAVSSALSATWYALAKKYGVEEK